MFSTEIIEKENMKIYLVQFSEVSVLHKYILWEREVDKMIKKVNNFLTPLSPMCTVILTCSPEHINVIVRRE